LILQSLPQRFVLVLKKLIPYLLSSLSKTYGYERLTEHTRLDSSTVDGLLNTGCMCPLARLVFAIKHSSIRYSLAANSRATNHSSPRSPQQFETYLYCTKNSPAIIGKLLSASDIVRILFEHGPARRWLDLK